MKPLKKPYTTKKTKRSPINLEKRLYDMGRGRFKADFQLERNSQPRVHEQIVRQVKEVIRKGRLKPGDQLLPERQLAEVLGVSRTAVRESFSKLASMGLIEIRPKEGAYVKAISLDNLVEPLATIILNERASVNNLFEVREILETKVVHLAAERATPQDIARIQWSAHRVIEDIKAKADASESDTEFHQSLAMATHNELLLNMICMMTGLMREAYGPARRGIMKGPNANLYGKNHLDICDAIAAHEGKEAERLMAEHINLAKRETMEYFGRMKKAPLK